MAAPFPYELANTAIRTMGEKVMPLAVACFVALMVIGICLLVTGVLGTALYAFGMAIVVVIAMVVFN